MRRPGKPADDRSNHGLNCRVRNWVDYRANRWFNYGANGPRTDLRNLRDPVREPTAGFAEIPSPKSQTPRLASPRFARFIETQRSKSTVFSWRLL
jgi:hypothetical protein